MPVLPAVPSTTVPPGSSAPLASASSRMPRAARSFTDPPGFMNSALPRISQPVSSLSSPSRISGVFPTAPTKPWVVPARAAAIAPPAAMAPPAAVAPPLLIEPAVLPIAPVGE